jgi:hypothetical protein
MDRATGQLDRLIQNRATGTEAANERARIWRQGLEEYHDEHEEARRHMWATYFRTLARTHAALSEENERRAADLTERKDND